MNNALKGALWSGVMWPGLGQVILKRYKRGAAIMLAVGVILTLIVAKAARLALAILEKIELQGGAIDMGTIADAARASTRSGSLTFNLLTLLLIACWIIGVADAYRIGRKMDLESHRPVLPPSGGR